MHARASVVGRKAQKALMYFSTVLFFLSAGAISFSIEQSAMVWPFASFAVGHAVMTGIGYLMNERPFVLMNAAYLIFDVWAILTRIGSF